MSDSEHDSDFSVDGEDFQQPLNLNKKKSVKDVFNKSNKNQDDDDDESDDYESEDDKFSIISKTKSSKSSKQELEDSEVEANQSEDNLSESDKEEVSDDKNNTPPTEKELEKLRKEKLDRLKKLKSNRKTNHKTGVVYMSKIPPYMKPAKMRQILTRFGEVDRLFLKREDESKYKQRIRGGGNKKIMYEEGWAEYIRKKDAKLCASTMNGNIIGGKKGSFYYDDVMNIKYLSGFKWSDLTEQIAKENDIRQSKLELEISQANKLNSEFIRNVEKSKMINNIRRSNDGKKNKKRKQEATENDSKYGSEIKQRKIITNRVDAPEHTKKASSKELNNVLSNLF